LLVSTGVGGIKAQNDASDSSIQHHHQQQAAIDQTMSPSLLSEITSIP
jgi:hypothetical protein